MWSRLERNRESARQSRKRKKEQLDVIEDRAAAVCKDFSTVRQELFEVAPCAQLCLLRLWQAVMRCAAGR